MPYLVVKTLNVSQVQHPVHNNRVSGQPQQSALIKRLYVMRTALCCFDLSDASSQLLKELLLRCFIEPGFLKSKDGIKLLAFLLALDRAFVPDIHQTIQNQIMDHTRKSVVEKYGLVIFKAWFSAGVNGDAEIDLDEGAWMIYEYVSGWMWIFEYVTI